MLRAVLRALELRREHGIQAVATEEQIDAALDAAGLTVRPDRPYEGPIRGMLRGRTVYVRRWMDAGDRTVVKAHELGHWVLHASDANYQRDAYPLTAWSRVEAEAHIFAWTLVVGRPCATLAGLTAQTMTASRAGIPSDFLLDVVSILTTSFAAVQGMPLLQLA